MPEFEGGPLSFPREWSLEAGQSGTAQVLVVDDDPHVSALVVDTLSETGYRAFAACSAKEALAQMRATPFALVLCDVHLRDADGLALARSLTETRPSVPVVLFTGNGHRDQHRDVNPTGYLDTLLKPFSPEALPSVIERNLKRIQADRERLLSDDRRVLVEPLRGCAAAIDMRNALMLGHSERVAHLSGQIGVALGLDSSEAALLQLAAALHDIGKIVVPDTVLDKRSPLTEEDWSLIRQHPVVGARIVGKVRELAYVADAVRHHHERYDGSGYPDNLAAESIPLLARVIAVADAVDAMTGCRPYRRRMNMAEALLELRRCEGTQFDPLIVRAAERALGGEDQPS